MNDDAKQSAQPVERPDAILAGVAGDAYQAYNAMETTKRRHYQLLEVQETRKKNYNIGPSEQEQRLLAGLLKDHDEQVRRFTTLSSELKQTDADAHRALFVYIGSVSRIESQSTLTH